jgi:hypothetical protein
MIASFLLGLGVLLALTTLSTVRLRLLELAETPTTRVARTCGPVLVTRSLATLDSAAHDDSKVRPKRAFQLQSERSCGLRAP